MKINIPPWAITLFLGQIFVLGIIGHVVRVEPIITLLIAIPISAYFTYISVRDYGTPTPPPVPKQYRQRKFNRKTIFQQSEQAFFHMLSQAVDQERFQILAKIGLWAVVEETDDSGRQKIRQKTLDYILYDKTQNQAIVAIEMIDPPHYFAYPKLLDIQKEDILKEAGIPLVGFTSYNCTINEIKTKIEKAIRETYQK